jgi:hypothetical protein
MSFIQNTVVLGLTGTQLEKCSPTNDAIDDMKESDGNQTKVDIYSAGANQKSNVESFGTTYDNYLNDTENAAWMKMQVAVAEAYQDGASKDVALIEARQAISNYYAVKQRNLIENWETTYSQWRYLKSTAENESDVSGSFVTTREYFFSYSDRNDGYTAGEVRYENVQLVNGNTTNVTSMRMTFDWYDGENEQAWSVNWNPSQPHIDPRDEYGVEALQIKAPNDNYDALDMYRLAPQKERWDRIVIKNDDLQAEAENFVNATYADFDSGEANASDVISSNTAMFEYGTAATSNDSSLYDSTAALSMMGFDTPNMSNSGTQDVTYNGNTYTGIVLARNAPGGSWETGTTYNTSNITGPVFLATTDGQKIDFADGSEFTIDQMRAKDGTNTTSVETTKYVYKTANTSELNQMQSDLTDLRAEIEAREPSGGGGSGSGIGTNTIIAAAALAGAALLFGRGNQ